MFQIQNYISFITAIIVFQMVPGPGTLTILNATARSGIGAGFGAVIGTLLGDFLYMAGAVLGLAAVMHAYPAVFEALQWLGAGYLCWLGIKILRSTVTDDYKMSKSENRVSYYFRQAFTVSITNPKVILFFIAFFPLFLHNDAPSITLGVMMAHVTIISFLYQSCLVLVGNAMTLKLSSLPTVCRLANRLTGMAIIGFGLKLAVNNR